MSDDVFNHGASTQTDRAGGPPERWYVYVAAIIGASFFSNLLGAGISGFVDGFSGADLSGLAWFGLVTGAASGLVWGVMFAWAKRLRLVIVVPLVLASSAFTLGFALYDVFTAAEISGRVQEMRTTILLGVSLHLAAFWLVFLGLAIRARRRAA